MTTAQSSATALDPRAVRLLGAIAINAVGRGLTLPFLLIYLHEVRHMSLSLVGVIMGVGGLVALTVMPSVGSAIDRFGAKQGFLFGSVLLTVGTAMLMYATQPSLAFLSMALTSIGHSTNWASVNAMIAGISTPEQRQRVFSVQFMLLNAGIGIGGIAAGSFADVDSLFSFQVLFGLNSAAFVVSGLLVAILPIGAKIAGPDKEEAAQPQGWSEVLHDQRMWWLSAAVFLAAAGGYGLLDAGLPAFGRAISEVSTRTLGYAFAANTIVIVLAQLLVLRLVDGRRRTRVLMGMALSWAVCVIALGASGLVDGVAAAVLVVAAPAFFAIGETLWSPTLGALVADLSPPHLRGRYASMQTTAWNGALMAGPMVVGLMVGHGLGWWYLGVSLAAALAMTIAVARLELQLTPAQNGVERKVDEQREPATATAGQALPEEA